MKCAGVRVSGMGAVVDKAKQAVQLAAMRLKGSFATLSVLGIVLAAFALTGCSSASRFNEIEGVGRGRVRPRT